ncbi:MAG: hypothetical protein MJ169_06480 [Treponema sp.]|nr:hypothetical protein [Treponema sp.]
MANCFFYNKEKSEVKPVFDEAARYLGYTKSSQPDAAVTELIKVGICRLHDVIIPKLVYSIFDVTVKDDKINFADMQIESHSLAVNLSGCKKILLLAGTIGAAVDSMIRKSQVTDSVMAGVMQACGAMFIESFIDDFNDFVNQNFAGQKMSTRPRFSPGYGDVPLEVQKDFFRLLECNKIGLTLMDSLIMAPEKSVTAFIGIKDEQT